MSKTSTPRKSRRRRAAESLYTTATPIGRDNRGFVPLPGGGRVRSIPAAS